MKMVLNIHQASPAGWAHCLDMADLEKYVGIDCQGLGARSRGL